MKHLLITLTFFAGSVALAQNNLKDYSESTAEINVAQFINEAIELNSNREKCNYLNGLAIDVEFQNDPISKISKCSLEFMLLYKEFLKGKRQDRALETRLYDKDQRLMTVLSLAQYPTLNSELKTDAVILELENLFYPLAASEREVCNAACSKEFIKEVKSSVEREVEKGNIVGAVVEIIDPKEPIEKAKACYSRCGK